MNKVTSYGPEVNKEFNLTELKSSFSSADNEASQEQRVITVNRAGDIILTKFALTQILHGMFIETTAAKTAGAGVHPLGTVNLLAKLAVIAIELEQNEVTVRLERSEVQILRRSVETKLAHCEEERQAGSERFNADTYIGMKLLLLDIREWLSVTID